jgi:2Fe-2S ferredoxin
MAIVKFKGYAEVEVPVGTSILKAAQQVDAPEGYACGGVCACSTCHVYVTKGADLLSEAEEEEEDILDKAFDVRSGSRLGCQSIIEKDGEIEVEITRPWGSPRLSVGASPRCGGCSPTSPPRAAAELRPRRGRQRRSRRNRSSSARRTR